MKKILFLILVFLIILSGINFSKAVETSTNLILNSDILQTDSNGSPLYWKTGNWGTNAASFKYQNDGSNASLYVSLSSYSSGDAKWYFDDVNVSPNTQYTFSDSYKSDIPTDVVAQTEDANGFLSYQYLGSAAASADFKNLSLDFTTTQTASKITIFHLINQIGFLETKNFSLNLSSAPPPPPPPPPPPTILPTEIQNSSLETTDPTNSKMPQYWETSSWGTNTATFSYLNSGHTGKKSVQVKISKISSGDAKWTFSPVTVQPNAEYYFSDWFKSSISSEIVVRYTDVSGNESFQWLGTEAKSTSWKQTNYQFVTPANVETATVYHLIAGVGNLTTDDYLLKKSEPLVIINGVPNNSFEQTNDGSVPIAWRKENWGTNTAIFTYLNTGYTGTHSGKVQITKYTDGDAKWGYTPQVVIPGADYRFTDYYQSNVLTRVVVRVISTSGQERYMGLINAEPSLTWKEYTDIFTVPADAKEITVLHFISAVGYLITDDYSVTPQTIHGFNRAIVSLTFDDGWEDNYTSVLPVLAQYGFKSTQFYATTFIKEQEDEIYKIQAFADAGHEIGSHSVTHPFLTSLSTREVDKELSDSQKYLESIVGAGKVLNFASPYGDYNSQVVAEIGKYYRSHRSTDEGYNSKDNFNIYNIRVQNMTNATTLAQYQSWLQKAAADNTWLVLVYHRIGENPDQFETSPNDFSQQMGSLYSSGLTVMPINQALNEIVPQLN